MLLKSISPDKGAVAAWQPTKNGSTPYLALAAREGGGGGFDSHGGSLAVHAVDLSSTSTDCPVLTRCVLRSSCAPAASSLARILCVLFRARARRASSRCACAHPAPPSPRHSCAA